MLSCAPIVLLCPTVPPKFRAAGAGLGGRGVPGLVEDERGDVGLGSIAV